MNEYLRQILFLPQQASTFAREVDTLHYFVISVTMLGATFVTLVGAYLLVRYRSRPPRPDAPNADAGTQPHFLYELVAVVGLAVLFLVWWVIGVRQFMRIRVAPEGAMDVYVTAKKWMWKFAYPEGQRSIGVLYVPAGKPVRLLMTSRDVIHSFYVPDFRVKQDVLPGRYTTLWFEAPRAGTYDVFCAEYCGTEHSMMRATVVVLDPNDYGRWRDGTLSPVIAETRPTPETHIAAGPQAVETPGPPVTLAREGERVAAEQGCLRCHTLDGTPHIGPTWAGLYRSVVPLEGGGTKLADEAYLTESMMDPNAKIHQGFAAVMPSYQGILDAPEAAAIVELIKSLRARPHVPTEESAP